MSLIESYRDAERQDIADNRRMCFKIQEIENITISFFNV